MGPGDLPVVWVRTAQSGQFSSRDIQTSDPVPFSEPTLGLYPSTHRFCRAWLGPSVPIPGTAFQVALFIVAVTYATVNRQILTLVHHCLFSMYWPPWWSKQTESGALAHPDNERQWSLNSCWLCTLGDLGGDRLYTGRNEALATCIVKGGSENLPTPSWKWASTEWHQCLVVQLR